MKPLNNSRNYGIDALRLFAIYLIVTYHVITHGGFASVTGNYQLVRLLLFTVTFCAVDCFAIISGFVGYTEEEKPYHFHKYISMWLQVFCYSFIITLIASFFDDSITKKDIFLSAFPVLTDEFWYFTAYTPLFFLIPWVNKLIRACTKKELTVFVCILLSVFSVFSFVTDSFRILRGYSFVWLTVLYIVGAWIKKCDIASKFKTWIAWLALIFSILFTWFARAYLPEWTRAPALLTYSSPTMACAAICFVTIFSKMKPNGFFKRTIAFAAPTSFGIYIFHCQDVVWTLLIVNRFTRFADLPLWVFPFAILGASLVIFLISMIADKLRELLFKLLRIDRGAKKLCDAIAKKAVEKTE
ncbi:MAG: acyltransferase [Clostridia bacterium]|nr:acyltransferase [Clostridia bacterium]